MALRRTYGDSWKFLISLPLIAVAAIGFEVLQHVVEWRAGMYGSLSGMQAAAHDPLRMASGCLKVGWLIVLGYWTSRFVVSRSPGLTTAFDAVATRKFAWVFLLNAGLGLLLLLGPELSPAVGLSRRMAAIGFLVISLATFPINVMLSPWAVGAALGDTAATIPFALRRARGSVLWGLALTILAPLPLMAVHYALGYGAVGRPPPLSMAMLALDAVLVGLLGVVANVSQVVLAQRMADRAGDKLRL